MKSKQIFFCSIFIFVAACSFADINRFYKGGRLIDVMYVDATSGLRVREKPGLNAKQTAVLPHAVIVKLIAVGKTTYIDGKDDPWIEILLPGFMWKNKGVKEYGWVYGGYLVEERPEAPVEVITGQALFDFLSYVSTWRIDTSNYLVFESNGTFSYKEDSIRCVSSNGTFNVKGATVTLHHSTRKISETFTIRQMQKAAFTISDASFIANGKYKAAWDSDFARVLPLFDEELFYFLDNYQAVGSNYPEEYENILSKIISRGFIGNSEDTEYMKKYRSYWDPIMKRHQEAADKQSLARGRN